jgi:hypothetical protein
MYMIFMTNARDIFYRGIAHSREDPQTPVTLGSENQTTTRALEYHIDYTDSQVSTIPAGKPSISAIDLPPQHHEVKFDGFVKSPNSSCRT